MRAIFNLVGIVMPPVMLNGQVVGKWKKKNRKLQVMLFANVGRHGESVIREKAESFWDDISSIKLVR